MRFPKCLCFETACHISQRDNRKPKRISRSRHTERIYHQPDQFNRKTHKTDELAPSGRVWERVCTTLFFMGSNMNNQINWKSINKHNFFTNMLCFFCGNRRRWMDACLVEDYSICIFVHRFNVFMYASDVSWMYKQSQCNVMCLGTILPQKLIHTLGLMFDETTSLRVWWMKTCRTITT